MLSTEGKAIPRQKGEDIPEMEIRMYKCEEEIEKYGRNKKFCILFPHFT